MKARLLLERNISVIENEYERTGLMSDFIQKHEAIDAEIKKERQRRNFIKNVFLILDIVFTSLIIGTEGYLHYSVIKEGNKVPMSVELSIYLFPSILTVLSSLILVISAFYLTM